MTSKKKKVISLADRMRKLLKKQKPGYGSVDTDESISINNRSDARLYLPGHGPWLYFKVEPNPDRRSGQTRAKRNAARERARIG